MVGYLGTVRTAHRGSPGCPHGPVAAADTRPHLRSRARVFGEQMMLRRLDPDAQMSQREPAHTTTRLLPRVIPTSMRTSTTAGEISGVAIGTALTLRPGLLRTSRSTRTGTVSAPALRLWPMRSAQRSTDPWDPFCDRAGAVGGPPSPVSGFGASEAAPPAKAWRDIPGSGSEMLPPIRTRTYQSRAQSPEDTARPVDPTMPRLTHRPTPNQPR